MPKLATVDHLNEENFVIAPPEEQKLDKKDSKGKVIETIKYFTSKTFVKEDNEEKEFFLNYPRAKCIGGIQEKKMEGKISKSIKLIFVADDDEERDALALLEESNDIINSKMRKQMFEHRGKLGLKGYKSAEDIRPPLVKDFMYFPTNDDGDRIAGSNMSQYVKLMEFDNGRTPFFDLNDQPVSWDLLQNVEFDCLVTVRMRHYHHGSTMTSYQFQAKQVQIISSIKPVQTRNMQSHVSEFYREKNADLVRSQQETIKNLQAKLDSTPQVKHKPETSKQEDDDDDDFMK